MGSDGLARSVTNAPAVGRRGLKSSGTGGPRTTQADGSLFSAYETDCPMCNGQGVVGGERDSFGNYDTDECPDCGGDGIVVVVAGVAMAAKL